MATMAQAIRLALRYGETHLGVTDIFGEDVGPPLGGVFTVTQGLETAWNTPLDERGIIGTALGLALAGQKPVCEIQFGDYIFNTIDLLKLVGNTRWSTNGMFKVPLVCMTIVGAGIHGSIYHSHSFESMAAHIPGWKIVLPSTPKDAYGLMISALKDENPVFFLYPKALIRMRDKTPIPGVPDDAVLHRTIDAPTGATLYEVMEARKQWQPQWPESLTDFSIPLGKANVVQEGTDVTVVTYARHVHLAKEAAASLKQQGIQVELIDLRSLVPWDRDCVFQSVKKTGRVLIINEDTAVVNYGEHLLREVVRNCFYDLLVRPRLLAGANLPGVGLHPNLEKVSVPQVEDIKRELLAVMQEQA
jgi:2-oxoisovalerate dehydrogenase E1 component beta subunit